LGQQKRILVDISSLVAKDHGGGIQRFQRSIIECWGANSPEDFQIHPIYFSFEEKVFKYLNPQHLNISSPHETISDEIVEISSGDIYFNTDLNYRFTTEFPNFFSFLRKQDIQIYFIIYDLLPLTMPNAFPLGISELHANWIDVAIRQSFLICISNNVMKECLELGASRKLPTKATSITLGHNSTKPLNTIKNREMNHSSNDRIRFLVVSTIEIRKSHQLILDAFEILWKQGLEVDLTFVGRAGWKVDELLLRMRNHQLLDQKFFWLSNLTDYELDMEYLNSTVLINASLGEGFGLPIVEASAHGIPLILRDIPIFREVAGDDPWYFQTSDPLEFSQEIKNWIHDYANGRINVGKNLNLSTWQDTSDQIIEILKKNDRTQSNTE
jgi:glycosyltransferase involved in cell wall biosynthesis